MTTPAPNRIVIDLGEFSSPDSIVLSGRPKGEAVRKRFDLDAVDGTDRLVLVKIPLHIISVNSSFFLGLFGTSIKTLGGEAFERRFAFECHEEVNEDIDRGKREAVNEANALRRRSIQKP